MPHPTNAKPPKLAVINLSSKETTALAAAKQDAACPLCPTQMLVTTSKLVLQ